MQNIKKTQRSNFEILSENTIFQKGYSYFFSRRNRSICVKTEKPEKSNQPILRKSDYRRTDWHTRNHQTLPQNRNSIKTKTKAVLTTTTCKLHNRKQYQKIQARECWTGIIYTYADRCSLGRLFYCSYTKSFEIYSQVSSPNYRLI